MRKLSAVLAIGLAGAIAGPTQAAVVTYAATLTGEAENPDVVTSGTGTVSVIVDDVLATMRVIAVFSGLIGKTTAAHIHCCNTNLLGHAGVATTTPTFPGFQGGVTFGSYDSTFDMNLASSWNVAFVTTNGGTTASAFGALRTGLNAGGAYFNLHTTSFGGGEIRGQLQTVPEPGTLALVLGAIGLAAVGAGKRWAV